MNGRGLKISHLSRHAVNGTGSVFFKELRMEGVGPLGLGVRPHTCSFQDLVPAPQILLY